MSRPFWLRCFFTKPFLTVQTQTFGCRCKSTVATSYQTKGTKSQIQRPSAILLDGEIAVDVLARKMARPAYALLKVMRDAGVHIDRGPKTVIDEETAEFLLLEFNVKPIFPKSHTSIIERLHGENQIPLVPRPPVVTIMGHVDHGKTTLLDNLRKTSVAENEAGGITQHIGAFSVNLPSGKQITFIDTPGHAAFIDMRSRGSRMTDVVVLVVAANDGVQKQTLECISHIKAAKVPVVVAINKIDKRKINISTVKSQLFRHGLNLEEFGGDVAAVEISALKGLNFDKLEETIVLQADLLSLVAPKTGYAQGVILEARVDKQKGLMSTVLVQKGELKKGSSIIAGTSFARVRQLFDERGKPVNEAIPSQPVQVLGWRDLPALGDTVYEVENEEMAKELIGMQLDHHRKQRLREQRENTREQRGKSDPKILEQRSRTLSLGSGKLRFTPYRILLRQQERGGKKVQETSDKKKLEIIVKADVSGSLEALLGILKSFENDYLELSVMDAGVGSITEGDIQLAEAIEGQIYGFNIRFNKEMDALAKQKNIQIKYHNVIYNLLDNIKADLSSLLPDMYDSDYVGEAQVLKIFKLTGKRKKEGVVAGCRVKQGFVACGKDIKYKVLRNGQVKHEGSVKSLKHKLEETATVKADMDCGIGLENFKDFQEGDFLQCFKIVPKKIVVDLGS